MENFSDLSIPLGLSSLQLALTLQLAPSTAADRVTGDQKLHGHLQCAKEHDCDERPVVGAEQRPAAEEHGAGHPAECEQQRRDGLGGLFDGRRTDELPESGGKVRILSCRGALPANDGIARQIEGVHTGSNATVAESQHAVQRATSCLYILGARAGAVLS